MQGVCKRNATGPLLQAKWLVQQTVAQLFRQLLRELAQSPETMHKQYKTSPGKATKVAKNKKTRREIERERGRVSGRRREREQRQAAGEDKSIEYSPRAAMCQQLKLNLVNWKNTKHTHTYAHSHTHMHTYTVTNAVYNFHANCHKSRK